MEIKGYKPLYGNRTDRSGVLYEEGKDYHVDGPIAFGPNKNGMRMCVHLSDVFRFFDPKDISVAEVVASGELVEGEYHDWQESYTEMYAASDIHVNRFLSREEIIEIMKGAYPSDVVKFFATFNPTEEEAFSIVRSCNSKDFERRAKMAYLYFIKHIDVYAISDLEEKRKVIEKVLDNGQDSNQRSKGK
jgi:hypothetical protein